MEAVASLLPPSSCGPLPPSPSGPHFPQPAWRASVPPSGPHPNVTSSGDLPRPPPSLKLHTSTRQPSTPWPAQHPRGSSVGNTRALRLSHSSRHHLPLPASPGATAGGDGLCGSTLSPVRRAEAARRRAPQRLLKVDGSGLTRLLLSPYPFRESTKFCCSCTPRTAPLWPAPTPPSFVPERGELSHRDRSFPHSPCREEGPVTTEQASGDAQVLVSAPGPQVPRLRGRKEAPRNICFSGAPGGHPAVLRGRPSSLSAHLTSLPFFQLLGALPWSPKIKKPAPQLCLLVCYRILVQSCSSNGSSSAHRAGAATASVMLRDSGQWRPSGNDSTGE